MHFKVRFDGLLGFPGGLVDEGESVEQGLNRELEEEINLNLDEVKITESDLISIQRPTVNDEDPNLVCYFYAKGMYELISSVSVRTILKFLFQKLQKRSLKILKGDNWMQLNGERSALELYEYRCSGPFLFK